MEKNRTSRNFREYTVWQDAIELSTIVYKCTDEMPWFEKKGICDQLRRAVVSISSNIAEGAARPTDADFAHFLDVALGSAYEVESQLLISKNVGYIAEDFYEEIINKVQHIEVQIERLLKAIRCATQR